MTSSILNFFEARSRAQVEAPRGWTNQELAEFYRVADSLNQAGLPVETDLGVSDEGEPWFAFYHPDTADVVAHFARINGRFVAAGASLDEVVDGGDLREIIDRMMRTKPMLMPVGKGRGAGNLLLHPAIVLTAFVATALLTMQDAEASPLRGSHQADSPGASAEKPAKAAPTLIQKLLASFDSAGPSKQNTSDALNQSFQQIALQSAIAFAMAQIPLGTQAITGGDLFDTTATTVTMAKSSEVATISVASLDDVQHSNATLLQMQAAFAAETAAVTSGSHGDSNAHGATPSLIAGPIAAPTTTLIDAAIAVRDDAAVLQQALHSVPGLLEFLRDLSQIVPQQAPQSHLTVAANTGENGSVKGTADAVVKALEVSVLADPTHTAFLQSQLFKELFHIQSVDVNSVAAVSADGRVNVKFVFAQPKADTPAPTTTGTPAESTPPTVDPTTGASIVAAAPPVETLVKTGIEMFDHIIDYSVSFAASGAASFASDLAALDDANGHLLAGAKKIVLFDSHDLALDIYRISDDVVMVDIELLHISHDQAAAGHATATMTLPNGGTVELVGVLAPPPSLH